MVFLKQEVSMYLKVGSSKRLNPISVLIFYMRIDRPHLKKISDLYTVDYQMIFKGVVISYRKTVYGDTISNISLV